MLKKIKEMTIHHIPISYNGQEVRIAGTKDITYEDGTTETRPIDYHLLLDLLEAIPAKFEQN